MKQHGVTFHKTAVLIFTAVRNSNLTKYLFCFGLQKNYFWFCWWNFKEIGVVNGQEFERNILMCERNLFTLCCCVYGVRLYAGICLSKRQVFVGGADLIRCITELRYRNISASVGLGVGRSLFWTLHVLLVLIWGEGVVQFSWFDSLHHWTSIQKYFS
jgi:hypothetical protein